MSKLIVTALVVGLVMFTCNALTGASKVRDLDFDQMDMYE